MVGDIFDFWISDHLYFIEKFSDIVEQIDRAVQKGIEVHYFEGNHDLHLERYWERKVGVKVHKAPTYLEIGEKTVRVEHGDLIDPDDKGYLFLKSVLQTSAVKFMADNIHEKLVSFIGENASKASRKYTTHQKTTTEENSRTKHRKYAHKSYREREFDLMVSGHIHIKDEYCFEDEEGKNKVKAVNLGTWLKEPNMFCMNEKGEEFQLLV